MANKTNNSKQCTILWHVDDLKSSHVDPKVVTGIIERLEQVLGKEVLLTINRGKIHEYLGMTLDFSTPGKAKILMIDYIENMLGDKPAEWDEEAATAAVNHLFEVNTKDPVMLDEDKVTMFYHHMVQILFLCKRARPDIQTAVVFLCTRVKGPDNDDYKKLGRVIKYLQGSKNMPLMLEGDNACIIKWWADASFTVHLDAEPTALWPLRRVKSGS
jgi:hypothetical protein